MEPTFETIQPKPKKGNRILIFTLGALFLFSIGSYAFGAGLYHPGDTTDPTCAPGTTNCYVNIFPDDSGHAGEFLTTDGSGNVSWATPAGGGGGGSETFQDVLGNGNTTDGSTPILGQNFLQFDGTGENGILNSNGDPILSDDGNDNISLTGYDGSHTANGTIGFNSNGDVDFTGQNIIGDVPVSHSIDAATAVGTLTSADLGITLVGSFNIVDDRATNRQDVVGTSSSGFGSTDAAFLAHADSSHDYASASAFDKAGLPYFTTNAVNNSGMTSLTTTVNPDEYKIVSSVNGILLDIKPSSYIYNFGDAGGQHNSTSITLNDSTNIASIDGYLNTSTPPPLTGPSFSGTGANDMTPSGSFSGGSSATFNVTVNQVNAGSPTYTSKTGPFIAAETLTVTGGPGAGSTATYVSDTGGSSGTLVFKNETIVGSGITVGSVVTGGLSTSSATIDTFSGPNDYITWTSSDGGSGGPTAVAASSPISLTDGISITFAASTGHVLGDTWTFGYTYPAGRMLVLNGQTGVFALGDVDHEFHGTKIQVNDIAKTVSITGSGGTCTFNGGATGGTCFSDERLKQNIQDLPSELDQIDELRPVTFTWIDPTMPQTQNTGFIAQDVQKIFPQLVSEVGDTGYLGVAYDGFIVPAIKAIQELDAKVEPLTSIDPTVNGSLASLIMQFLSNTAISIKDATIGTLHIGGDVCADNVCVTQEQFKNMLLQAGGTTTTPQPVTTNTSTTTTSTNTGDTGTTTDGTASGTSSGTTDSSSTGTSSGSDTTTTSDSTSTSDSSSSSSGDGTTTDATTPTTPTAPVTPPADPSTPVSTPAATPASSGS